jgi:hypothetical protein
MNATFGTYGCPEATWAELAKALVRLAARISVVLSMQAVACPYGRSESEHIVKHETQHTTNMSMGGCELVAHLGVRVLTVLLEQLTFPSAFHGVPHCTYNLAYANMGLQPKDSHCLACQCRLQRKGTMSNTLLRTRRLFPQNCSQLQNRKRSVIRWNRGDLTLSFCPLFSPFFFLSFFVSFLLPLSSFIHSFIHQTPSLPCTHITHAAHATLRGIFQLPPAVRLRQRDQGIPLPSLLVPEQ